MRIPLKVLVLGGVLAGVLGVVVLVSGIMPIKASSGHFAVTAWILELGKKRSVSTHSIGIRAPDDLAEARMVLQGAGQYEEACAFCHGAPGIGVPRVANAATPSPPHLLEATQTYEPEELFYIVKHGIKFTGMPAWPAPSRDDEVWGVVAFLREFPELDRESYRALVYGQSEERPADAPAALDRCARCHGARGEGRGAGAFPVLAGQSEEYLLGSLQAYASGARSSGIMGPIAFQLTEVERRRLASWYSQQRGEYALSDDAPERPVDSTARAIVQEGLPGRKIAACSECHGPAAHEPYAPYPRLTGQWEPYLRQQLKLFSQGTRGGTEYARLMQTVAAHALNEEEIDLLAGYYGVVPRGR